MEQFSDSNVHSLQETAQWRSRRVDYCEGNCNIVLSALPEFDLVPFTAENGILENPFYRTVVRKPRLQSEQPIPIGIVSNTYTLAQHVDVVEVCLDGLLNVGIDPDRLRFELGLSEFGEWMNLRIYFPEQYDFIESPERKIQLRLECFNSVDGSCRLVVLFGWFRFVCSNGMVIGDSKIEIRERHSKRLNLQLIAERLLPAIETVSEDRERMESWQGDRISIGQIEGWSNTYVTEKWGKKAAARVFHICRTGKDVDIDLFVPGPATEKPIRHVRCRVSGQPDRASTKYDVLQSLSYVATRRRNADERVAWQSDLRWLLERLPVAHGDSAGSSSQ